MSGMCKPVIPTAFHLSFNVDSHGRLVFLYALPIELCYFLIKCIAPNDDIDFDRAASAFPDISLDGEDDIPVPAQLAPAPPLGNSGFSFDDFNSPPPIFEKESSVKVTGDDDIDKFENEFPDIDVGPVR